MLGQGKTTGCGGGGFLTGGTDSPAGHGRRSQNIIIPATVRQLLDCKDDVFKLEGVEANVITIVGLVTSVESTTTNKMSICIDDQTGTIECVKYVGNDEDGGNKPPSLFKGMYGRVTGVVRSTMGYKYVLVFRSEPVTNLNELTCHILEVIQAPIKLKLYRAAEDNKIPKGGELDNTWSNSVKISEFGASVSGNDASGGIQVFTANQKLVHEIISRAKDENGMHRDQVVSAVKARMTLGEIFEALEFLNNEGHIFSTVDDDHYKTTSS